MYGVLDLVEALVFRDDRPGWRSEDAEDGQFTVHGSIDGAHQKSDHGETEEAWHCRIYYQGTRWKNRNGIDKNELETVTEVPMVVEMSRLMETPRRSLSTVYTCHGTASH